MRIAYLDCASGISGDMTLGALVDSGVSLSSIQEGIDSLGLPHCHLSAQSVKKNGFRATQVSVQFEPEHKHRHLHHILEMIENSSLTDNQKQLSQRIFTRLGEAEAKVHGTPIEKVHFHEVGAVDSIADIVGAAIGWDLLRVERVVCSPIPTGQGFVKIDHGLVSVPAPATAELLVGVPLETSQVKAELTTPTGAAIATTLAAEFGPRPAMILDSIGLGAGARNLDEQPNILRLLVGQTRTGTSRDTVWLLQTNLDDAIGEWIGYCCEQLLQAGALDAYVTPIQMKKNRPAVILGVLCSMGDVEKMEQIIFRETGALGIRRWPVERTTLHRRSCNVETQWGRVEGKLAILPDGTESFSPEFEACRRLAQESGQPLRVIYHAARRAFDLLENGKSW